MKLCLVVSADRDTSGSLRGVIRDLGFPCIYMENREEALTACAALMPDIIILDNNDGNVDAFLPRLRALKKGAFPVVLQCGAEMSGAAVRDMLRQSGAQGYLARPFDRDAVGFKLLQLGLLPQEAVH